MTRTSRLLISFLCVLKIGAIGGCYSFEFYRMEVFSKLCWDCGEVELSCDLVFQSQKDLKADDFEFPVGSKSGHGYYIAQGFGEVNSQYGGRFHLGEDWNYQGGGDSDYSAPIYSIGAGIVTQVKSLGGGWGLVVRVCHKLRKDLQEEFGFKYIEAIYAHLHSTQVAIGDPVGRGQWIASIGDGDGRYISHLHFELRSDPGREIGGGYSKEVPKFFIHPIKFLSQFQKRFAPN